MALTPWASNSWGAPFSVATRRMISSARRQRRLLADGGQHGLQPSVTAGLFAAPWYSGEMRPRAAAMRASRPADRAPVPPASLCMRPWRSLRPDVLALDQRDPTCRGPDAIGAASSCGELGAPGRRTSSRARGLALPAPRAWLSLSTVAAGVAAHQPIPVVGLHAGDALLSQRLDVRRQRMARRRGDARLELAALDVPEASPKSPPPGCPSHR